MTTIDRPNELLQNATAIVSKKRRSASDRQLSGIEVLRFISAFAILIWHYQHFFFLGIYDSAQARVLRPTFPLYQYLRYPYEYGYWAVQVFWVVSGFIFFRQYAESISNHQITFTEFGVRRFSRLYPLHFITLIAVAFLQTSYFHFHGQYFLFQDNNIGPFIAQLVFASKWFSWQPYNSFNAPIWSISVEILVYFLFFYTTWRIGKGPLVAVAAASLNCMVLLHIGGDSGLFLARKVFECAVFFFAGGVAYGLVRRHGSMFAAIGIFIVVLCAFSVGLGPVLVGAICLVLLSAKAGEMRCGAALKHLTFLGNATYSSYLMHFPIQLATVLAIDALGYDRSVFFSPLAFIAYLAAVTAISLLTYNLFELPAQNWIRRYAESKGLVSKSGG